MVVQLPIVGQIYRKARRERGLSQFQACAALGRSQSLLSALEHYGALPSSLATLRDLASITGADFAAIHQQLILALPALRAAHHALALELESSVHEQHAVAS